MISTFEAAKAANVSVRQLHHWADRGYLTPTVDRATSGGQRGSYRWSERDVYVAGMLGAVSSALGLGARSIPTVGILQAFAAELSDAAEGQPCALVLTIGVHEVVLAVRPHVEVTNGQR